MGRRGATLLLAAMQALVAYYSAAVTFHVESGDPPRDAAPAALFGALAATIV